MDEGLQVPQGEPASSTPDTPPETPPEAPVEVVGDGWEGIEETFETGDVPGLDELPNSILSAEEMEQAGKGPEKDEEQPPQEPNEDADPGDPDLEVKGEDLWDTSKLSTPEEYAAHNKKVQAWTTKKNQEQSEKLDTATSANAELAKIVAEVAANPTQEKLNEIMALHGKELEAAGITVNRQALTGGSDAPGNEPSGADVTKALEAQKATYLDSVREYITGAEDDADLGTRVGTLLWNAFTQSQSQSREGFQAMMGYVDKATKGAVEPLMADRAQTAQVGVWDSAINSLSSDEGFKAAVAAPTDDSGNAVKGKNGQPRLSPLEEFINADEMLAGLVEDVNTDPEKYAKRGVTPAKVLKRAYSLMSGPDRVQAAATKAEADLQERIEATGEVPGVHQKTINTDGQDWEEIEAEDGDPFAASA